MYQNVYIDAVFAANFLMDYILLRLTGFFIREGRNRRRCLVAAAAERFFQVSVSVYRQIRFHDCGALDRFSVRLE